MIRTFYVGSLPAHVLPRCFAFMVGCLFLIQSAAPQRKLDKLLVHGDGFVFSVKEPAGWNGATTNAEKFNANLVLHEAGIPKNSYIGLIRILVNEKTDENIAEDMAADMRQYRERHTKAQFKDFAINHPGYKSLAKVFYNSGESYEYVAYVNPGPKSKFLFSVSMNTGKTEASEKELVAFSSTLQSLTLF